MKQWLAGHAGAVRHVALGIILLGWGLAVLAAQGPQSGGSRLSIVLASDEWPPYLGSNLPDNGILSRVVTAAFARANVMVTYRFLPNNRSLQSARNGTADGSLGWAPSPERLQDLLYSQLVMSARMVFFQRKSDQRRWAQLADLAGLRIGITIGNFYSAEFDRLVQQGVLHTDGAADDLSNFRKLLARRIDLFPIEEDVGQFLLARNFSPLQAGQLVSSPAFWSAPLHVVIWRRHPQGAELIARFNRGLQALQSSGEFDRMVRETRLACQRSLP